MAKLYIPTSSLNFNNILSSESISPKAFYALRGYGYARWQEVEQNNLDNVILLYSQPFSFVRPESDLEDHPMLLEVITDESFPMVSDGIFCCDHTIYLSPWHTRFIFFSPQDKLVALSLSDSSLETKMLALYSQRLVVQEFPLKSVETSTISISLNKEAIERDFRINRMKGFLYGYYIGALLSNSIGIVKRANILQEIRNIFSSILSTEAKVPTVLQQEKLATLFNEIQKDNPIFRYLQSVVKESDCIEKIIKDLIGLGVVFPSRINSVENIIHSLKYATDGKNYAIDWLKREELELNQAEQQSRTPLQVSAEEVIMVDNSLSKIVNNCLRDDYERALVKAWCNEVLALKEYDGKVSIIAESLSDEVTIKAKAVYGASWDDSYSKTILNQMRRYVRGQDSNITWQDDVFSSIAAVIAKGSDWEQLRKFMQSKMMSDYKIAFAFFGELNGFANLTRDFTDVLFTHKDRNYVASVYKEIYGQLHGDDPSLGNDSVNVLTDKRLLPLNVVTQNVEITTQGLKEDVEAIIKAHPRAKISEKDRMTIYQALEDAQDSCAFVNMIAEKMESLDKGIFPFLQKELFPDWESPKRKKVSSKKKNAPKEANLFGGFLDNVSKTVGKLLNSGKEEFVDEKRTFYIDDRAWELVKDVIPIQIQEEVHEDLIWFQDEYQKGQNSKYYAKASRDNSLVIEALARLLQKKKYAERNKADIEKMIQRLHSYYV